MPISERLASPTLADTLGPNAPVEARLALFVLLTSLIHDINLVRGLVGDPPHSFQVRRGRSSGLISRA